MQCREWRVGARGRTHSLRPSGAWCRATLTLSLSPRSRVELQRSSPDMQLGVALLSSDLFNSLAASALPRLDDLPFESSNAVAGG